MTSKLIDDFDDFDDQEEKEEFDEPEDAIVLPPPKRRSSSPLPFYKKEREKDSIIWLN